jgi:hypothetical protein
VASLLQQDVSDAIGAHGTKVGDSAGG